MTHKQTWLEIAEAYLTPRSERTEKQRFLTVLGLCDAASDMGLKFHKMARLMGELVGPFHGIDYWWPVYGLEDYLPIHDELRGLQALFFAAMSAKDFNELLKG